MTSGDNPLRLLLRKLSAHSALDDDDRQAILALPRTVKTVEPQGYIVRDGDATNLCGVLVSGFAFRHQLTGAR